MEPYNLVLLVKFTAKGEPCSFDANYCYVDDQGWTKNQDRLITEKDEGWKQLYEAVEFIPKLIKGEVD